ncbi:MAG TPA: hypothetical protein VFT74_18765 [Isosphaeraceae bacterium]|nr:hypothetical protein [Isosphaeraceae bacterium]
MVPLGGGWNWVDLGTSCDDAEAAEMQHCGTDSRGTLISLRDPQGNAHVTMSYDGNTVHQIKGKQNTVPVRKYWPYIVQFFKQTGAKLDDWWLEAAAKELPGGDDFDHAPELMQLLAPFVKKKAPVREAALKRNNSVAMVIVPGEPPGRNVCAFVRSLVQDRSRVIVVAQSGRLAPGNFERMMRASMPDCEKKLRIMDASGPSLADALNSAQRNHHYSPSQALQVYCDQQTARGFQQEVSDGSLKFDPTVINIVPSRIPSDAGEDIVRAVKGGDESAMHRVLDPHIFSSQEGLGDYKQALLHTEGVIREATRWQNFMANTKLQTIPWELDNYVEGIEQWEKELPDDMGLRGPIYCSIVLLSAAEFSKRTKRGNPQTAGWMVDCEIFMVEPDDPGYPLWFFHSEKRFADIEQARAQVEKLKTFVDSKTLLELERYPKSGKIAMSKFESLLREGIKRKFPGEKLYVHFSSRPKPPRVPNRSMNFMSSGGPPGIYAYPMDAAMTYASDRTDAYVLRPRVEVLDVMKYTREQLERDIQRLSGMVDLSRSLRLWSRYEREVVRTGPPFAKLWYLLSRIPRAGDEYPPGVQETAFGNPQLGRELLLKLGYSAIEDSIGIIYGTEPKQVLFLTDESFEVIDHVQNPETFRSHETQRELVERLVDEVLREFLEEGNIFDIEVPSLDGGRLNEFGTGSPGSGANGPVQVRASNSSSWASGQLALSDPRNHVPEDENEEESDRALDWGPGRVSGASF